MDGDFPYPSSTAWYVRAGSSGLPSGCSVSEGSAAAVRLRKKGSSGPFRNFLLTCAHVVRSEGTTAITFGPTHAEIRAWPPGSGYNPANGFLMEPVSEVRPLDSLSVSVFYQQAIEVLPNADWALLEFKDVAKANDQALPIVQFSLADNPARGAICNIYGYAGGAMAFQGHDHAKKDLVRPSLPYGKQVVTAAANGVIEFQGSHSRPGMSGGGVFVEESGAFVGLHRQRNDSTQQLHAVSAVQIALILATCEYDIATGADDGRSTGPALGASPIDSSTFSVTELQSVAVTLLQNPASECRAGKRIEISFGSGKRLTIIVGSFASDSMQRLALKGDLDLLQTQLASIRHLEDRDSSGLFPGAAFAIQIQRTKEATDRTIAGIQDRIRLMVDEFRMTANV